MDQIGSGIFQLDPLIINIFAQCGGVFFIVSFFLLCHPLPLVLLCELRLSGVKRSRAWSFTSIKGFMFGEGSDLMA